jgi:outer membrane murein-binding lipoprotein Lpp
MNKDLINKLLNEQTTPEEEHLIAQKLRQEEDMDRWLTEDETAAYDRIVSRRLSKRRYLRWAVAALVAIVLVAGTVVLWPKQDVSPLVVTTGTIQKPESTPTTIQDTILVAQQTPTPKQKSIHTDKRQQVTKPASTVDSLQYYIARLEHELENVNESTYTAKAEEVLRADARLQKLVQRIMIGELTKDDMLEEAMNINRTTEE